MKLASFTRNQKPFLSPRRQEGEEGPSVFASLREAPWAGPALALCLLAAPLAPLCAATPGPSGGGYAVSTDTADGGGGGGSGGAYEQVGSAGQSLVGVSTGGTIVMEHGYIAQLREMPQVSAVTPDHGRMFGNQTVTVSGADFIAAATVTFDPAYHAASVSVVGPTTITCTTPSHHFGFVDVTVAIPGDSATLTDGFKYLGIEGDVDPRTSGGDEVLTLTDLSQERRLIAALDTVAAGQEFQKADMASDVPGDGVMNLPDLSQMRRYVAALDPRRDAGGPYYQGGTWVKPEAGAREVLVAEASVPSGGVSLLSVQLNSEGDETALGFTLTFDPTVLKYRRTAKGEGAKQGGFALTVNDLEASRGRLGIVVDSDRPFEAGWQDVIKVEFAAAQGARGGYTTVDFAAQPTPLGASNADAEALGVKGTAGRVRLLSN